VIYKIKIHRHQFPILNILSLKHREQILKIIQHYKKKLNKQPELGTYLKKKVKKHFQIRLPLIISQMKTSPMKKKLEA